MKILGYDFLDVVEADHAFLHVDQVAQGLAGGVQVVGLVGEVDVGDDPAQRAFQFADMGADFLGDEEGHFLRQIDAAFFRLAKNDGHAGFQIVGLDGDRQSPAEARLQALFQPVHLFGIAVAGDDDLPTAVKEGVEGVKKLLLGAILARKKLDVVDEQGIQLTVALLEVVDGVMLQGAHHVHDEAFGAHIEHLGIGIALEDGVAHRLHEMGLAQSDAAIDIQGVVGFPRVFCDLSGSRHRELIGFALDVGLKGESGIEPVAVARLGDGRGGRRRRSRRDRRQPLVGVEFQAQQHPWRKLGKHRFQQVYQPFPYPLHDEGIGCEQAQFVTMQLATKGAQPGVELLGGGLFLQLHAQRCP